ncbi:hypothetical protein [Rathayibacter tanaceti]|uniref:HTH araC/xylS-type domain-containing protein n=2 Tax=Rathayibacter tanaceti TaxID=1671680 RepID=A0A166IC88_9MICO|nr:hypothetical protein [Rathayibacter tanaceti]KZX22135.1 hypothetical protein ACH61_00702 [Rathayibacter tanaceti]QHC54480.1 hypothetical protein GSU10_01580 [Rathayibacter tanaceti]TCO35031.1 hypothetical protein EV639_10935 [Rathayibacter tanaceti]
MAAKADRPVHAERDVSLAGVDAAMWLAARGLDTASRSPPARIAADSIELRDLAFSRTWATPLRFSARLTEEDALLMTVVSGALDVEVDGSVLTVKAGGSLTLGPQPEAVVTASRPVAWILVRLRRSLWEDPRVSSAAVTTRSLPALGTTKVLIALVNSLLATSIDADARAWRHLSSAVEETVLALVHEHAPRADASTATTAEWVLFSRAMAIIDADSSDTGLTVAELVRRVNSSATRVGRAFSVHGTTAAEQIRLARVRTAQRLLGAARVTSQEELEAVARRAGFRTVATMWRSIRRSRPAASG